MPQQPPGAAPETGPGSQRASGVLVAVVALVVLAALAGMWWVARDADDPAGPASGPDPTRRWAGTPDPLQRPELAALADGIATTLDGDDAPPPPGPRLSQETGPVFAVLRDGGAWRGSAWASEGSAWESTMAAVAQATEDLEQRDAGSVDGVELCLSHSYQPVSGADGLPEEVDTGVRGLQIAYDGDAAAYAPTLMLANNWDVDDVFERFGEAYGANAAAARSQGVLHSFGCDQALVTLDGERARAVPMQRGNTLVGIEAVTRPGVRALADRMGAWMLEALHPDGRMTYEYWPSVGEESPYNNTIRQWMASLALVRFGLDTGDQRVLDLAARNIDYNLDNLYRTDGGLGLVVEPDDGDVKLGAAGLAVLAIMEHPQRERWATQEAALRRTVDELWREDGFFASFYPAGERDLENQNFYPGEALLMWAETIAETGDRRLLQRFMTSFEYYRDWHLQEVNRNPAFVPWHTQAYAQVWRVTKDRELLDFIFEMNDWLLELQQWEEAPYPDTRGRFYDPDRPQYGVPHASSTGVYLEGLAEAQRLATLVGDRRRADAYALAIRRGLREVMQLQFVDDVDLYYVSKRDRARGGIRTTVYDNRIRVDNVQHNLLAVLNVLRWWPGS